MSGNQFLSACFNGNLAQATRLLKESEEREIDLNEAHPMSGYTPLISACANRHTSIVKFLLEQKEIKVNLANIYGETAFSFACANEKIEIVKLLLTHKELDVNEPDQFGTTPLMLATNYGYVETQMAVGSRK